MEETKSFVPGMCLEPNPAEDPLRVLSNLLPFVPCFLPVNGVLDFKALLRVCGFTFNGSPKFFICSRAEVLAALGKSRVRASQGGASSSTLQKFQSQ